MTDIIIRNAWICSLDGHRITPVFGDIVIEKNRISDIQQRSFQDFLHTAESDAKKSGSLDAGGRMVIVPLVNFHEHFYSRLARGLTPAGQTDNFRQILQNLWWKLDRLLDADMIHAAVAQGCLESIRNGVTYLYDHHASPGSIGGTLSFIRDQLQFFGLRGVLCLEVSDRDGGEKARTELEENADFIENQQNSDVKGMLGLHAPFTLSDRTLENASGIRDSLNCGIHIHLAEDSYEQEFSHKRFRCSPVNRLEKHRLMTAQSLLVHGIHLTAADFQIIAEHGCAIVLNPDSNMNNTVGLPQYGAIPEKIPLLPGTDGMHAGVSRTIKQLFLLARHQGFSFRRATSWVEKIYFDSIDRVKENFPDFPELKTGDRADLVIWDYIPATPLQEANFWGHWIYGLLESRVHSVIQGGSFLMREYKLTGIEDLSLEKEIVRQGHRLFDKFETENEN